jgi:hypothetical protein
MNILRSIAAVAAGFLAIVATHTGTDQVMHAAGVFPPAEQGMHDPALNAIALAYRSVFTVFGCWLTARLAPSHPKDHALFLGLIGTALASAAAVATRDMNLGPAWYPLALAVSAFPLAWLGAALHRSEGGHPD